VEIVSTFIVPFSPIFMIEPLPWLFSIWLRAISSALSRSTGALLVISVRRLRCEGLDGPM
jgi:hypothetical protein